MSDTNILNLPNEIIIEVSKYLTVIELFQFYRGLSGTDKAKVLFVELSNKKEIDYYEKISIKQRKRIDKICKPSYVKINYHKLKSTHTNRIIRSKSIKHLCITHYKGGEFIKFHLPNLTKLEIFGEIIEYFVSYITFSRLESAPLLVSIVSKATKIEHIHLENIKIDSACFRAIENINLKQFILRNPIANGWQDFELYDTAKSFFEKQKNLEEIVVTWTRKRFVNDNICLALNDCDKKESQLRSIETDTVFSIGNYLADWPKLKEAIVHLNEVSLQDDTTISFLDKNALTKLYFVIADGIIEEDSNSELSKEIMELSEELKGRRNFLLLGNHPKYNGIFNDKFLYRNFAYENSTFTKEDKQTFIYKEYQKLKKFRERGSYAEDVLENGFLDEEPIDRPEAYIVGLMRNFQYILGNNQ